MTAIKSRQVDIASLAFFRIAFGLLMAFSMARYLAKGWVSELLVAPTYTFPYWGFGWVKALPEPFMTAHVVLLLVLALCVAAGFCYRIAMPAFFLGFTYLELIDKANYLNHYYLIAILAFLLSFFPANRTASVDVRINPRLKRDTVDSRFLTVLRLQVSFVYFFAGLAKVKADWLLNAQPLKIWLASGQNFPVIGPLFAYDWVAYLMSWSGALFDLGVPFFLLNRHTRKWAFAAVIIFHALTWKLFQIGMFPWVMIVAALIFFPPYWPRRVFPALFRSKTPAADESRLSRPLAILFVLHLAVQISLPLRHWLYPGNVCWTEEGFRFAWHVMLMEKTGSVEYRVTDPVSGKHWIVSPQTYLKPHQEKQMSAQPDMILQLAHHIADDFKSRGYPKVEVRADALASLNGRPFQKLIDETVNLAAEQDSLRAKPWIVQAQTE